MKEPEEDEQHQKQSSPDTVELLHGKAHSCSDGTHERSANSSQSKSGHGGWGGEHETPCLTEEPSAFDSSGE